MNKKQLARFGLDARDGEPFDDKENLWKWFGTLTFRESLSHSRAYRLFHRWFGEIEAKAGISSLNWVRVSECSPVGIRFHILVGGCRIGNKWPWILRWHELGADAFISYYRPGVFFHYVLSEAQHDSEFEIDMDIGGCSWIFRTESNV